jgi:DDE superfamily endonuclease
VSDTFGSSTGWLHKFKTRHNISLHAKAGEAASADLAGVELARGQLHKLLSRFPIKVRVFLAVQPWVQIQIVQIVTSRCTQDEELVNFAPENIFNMDETGLNWRQLPSRTLSTKRKAGSKLNKERVTLALGCNATGTEKLVPLAIGKAQKPRCFPKGDFNVRTKIGLEYFWNKSAWMLSSVFSPWVLRLNNKFAGQKRVCVLLVDNSSTHKVDGIPLRVRLSVCKWRDVERRVHIAQLLCELRSCMCGRV